MSTSFAILITGSPTKTQAHLSAIRFINASVEQGHGINNVFFYQDAVQVANRFNCPPSDETHLTDDWSILSRKHGFELQACVAASNRRAVISAEEAPLNGYVDSSVHQDYSVLGLGQLAKILSDTAHKLIHFK